MTTIRGIALRGNWLPNELRELAKIFAPIPAPWLENNPHLKTFERSQVLTNAPPEAPGHSKYDPATGSIVVYNKGVYHGGELDPEQFRRSVYHELAHTILKCHPDLRGQWVKQTRGDDFVDDYAKTSPDEDFADTFSEFFIFPKKIRGVVPKKTSFMQQLLAEARSQREKTAMPLLNSFTDELIKIAAGGGLSKILSFAKSPTALKVGKGAVLGAGGAAGGVYLGSKSGEEKGMKAGTKNMDKGMRQAYRMGIQRGAMAMRQSIIQQMRSQARPPTQGRRARPTRRARQ